MSVLLGTMKLTTGQLPPTQPLFAHPTAVESVASKPLLLIMLVGVGVVEVVLWKMLAFIMAQDTRERFHTVVVEVVLEAVLWKNVSTHYDAEYKGLISYRGAWGACSRAQAGRFWIWC
jgi:hypothetical protein